METGNYFNLFLEFDKRSYIEVLYKSSMENKNLLVFGIKLILIKYWL